MAMFEFMVMMMFHHCFRGVYTYTYILYIYIYLIFGQTQMYTFEIQLTNLIISNGIKKHQQIQYLQWKILLPIHWKMCFAMQKIHRHFFIWHFFPIIGWMEHQELGIPLGYVIETNPMKKPTDHFWSYLTLSPQIWRCGSKWQLLYIYIYIYIYARGLRFSDAISCVWVSTCKKTAGA